MSTASEWSRRFSQTQLAQPKFEAVPWDEGEDDDGAKEDGDLTTIAEVHGTGRLEMHGYTISAGDARRFARWILDTFGEPK